jgi:ribonuclease P protein component
LTFLVRKDKLKDSYCSELIHKIILKLWKEHTSLRKLKERGATDSEKGWKKVLDKTFSSAAGQKDGKNYQFKNMLTAKYRLKKGYFIAIYRQGKREYGRNLSLIYAANKNDFCRFGFVVSKKNVKTAIERNKIKRMLREFIRQKLAEGGLAKGFDVIVSYIGKDKKTDNKEMGVIIKREIELLFSRAHLAKK